MHVGVSLARMPSTVTALIDGSRILAVETTDESVDEPPEQSPREPLSKALGPAAWARLLVLLGPRLADDLDRASPGAVLSLLGMLFLDRDAHLDEELISHATERGLRVVGLETEASRATVVSRWLGASTLREFLTESRGRRELRDRTLEGLGDFRGRRESRRVRTGDSKVMHDELVVARNRAWMTSLETLLAGDGVFVAVGQGHLVGQDSVLELLQRRGYRIERVDL